MKDLETILYGGIAGILLLLVLRYNAKAIGRFFVRGIIGMITIYGSNQLLELNCISSIIAINPLTFLTSGFLGFPGVFLLYAINFLHVL